MKRVISLLLPFLLFLCSCDKQLHSGADLTEATTAAQTLSPPDPAVNKIFGVGYCLNEDGHLNPILKHAELNTALFSLIYDGLFKLDGKFVTQNVLCESAELNGTEVTLKLKQGVLFHDGSALTAADVVYSLELAKNNAKSAYARRLSVVREISAADDYTVKLILSSPRKSIASLLDIPVIKRNTGITNDAIGCGRYKITENEEILYLVPFDSYHGGVGGDIALIHILLTEIKDNDVLEYGVLSGNIDIIKVDELPEDGVHVYANADKYPVNTSDFIYLGLNMNYGALSNKSVRQAVALLIDTERLRAQAFNGHVGRAWGIYPEGLYENASALPEREPDVSRARSLISSAGYTLSEGMFKKPNGENLKISLLLDENEALAKAAEPISEMLAAGGIETEIKVLSRSKFITELKNARFDMYIGQVDVAPDFDFTFLLGTGGLQITGFFRKRDKYPPCKLCAAWN